MSIKRDLKQSTEIGLGFFAPCLLVDFWVCLCVSSIDMEIMSGLKPVRVEMLRNSEEMLVREHAIYKQ